MNRANVMEMNVKMEDPSLVMLARELHDGLSQYLMAAFCHLNTFRYLRETEPETAGKEFNLGFTALGRVIKELRALLSEIRPPKIQGVTLVNDIEDLIHEHAASHGILVQFSHSPQDIKLPSVLRTAVFRIIQEGLGDVRRHSRSEFIQLRIVQADDSVRIEIEDSEMGFDPTTIGENYSDFSGIRAIAALLSGEVCITCRREKGTLVVVHLPLSPSVNKQSFKAADTEQPRDEP